MGIRGLVLTALVVGASVVAPGVAAATPRLTGESVFLPNLDDDTSRCVLEPGDMDRPGLEVDRRLAACNDAADEVVNGRRDEDDLTELRLRGSEAARVEVDRGEYLRVFVRRGGQYRALAPGEVFSAREMRTGVGIAVEGRDLVRDPAKWDGRVRLTVRSAGRAVVKDMRVAPLLFQHDLMPATTVFAAKPGEGPGWPVEGLPPGHPGEWDRFSGTLRDATAGVETRFIAGSRLWWKDVWMQDLFEPAVVGNGRQTMRVAVRSANKWEAGGPTLRPAGRLLFRDLRGPDVGVVQEFTDGPAIDAWADQRNATGNFEALPPYRGYPKGRIYYGTAATGDKKPDAAFLRMLEAQGQQPPVALDTSWLMVGHVDETLHVVRADNARGWTLMVADPRLAESLLRQANGTGARLFDGTNHEYQPTVEELLGDADFLAQNETAARHIDSQVAIMLRETGLRAEELVRVPVLFHQSQRAPGMAALAPAVTNGLSVTADRYAAPDPHGPVVGGRDLFKEATERALRGIRVNWVEDVFWAHVGGGEVHCTTNAWRDTRSLTG
ncbi:protein-arginine deiminase domain-containing protein [Amycolatopsis sp. YIM 10]|uniref:protein-arginine deiminase domain-containing protein n=1 Tax=Amycolatopsis sp. YIM 10 TaxID=2653857 RepID=UPI0012A970C8|nr:protein-arginine deiminase domain-containing protein [Amycolatopsis sp. YIM 10]QFU92264.1 Protein-arginine deiminase (PAD) [Amycolatopsis sp. YIM 10]